MSRRAGCLGSKHVEVRKVEWVSEALHRQDDVLKGCSCVGGWEVFQDGHGGLAVFSQQLFCLVNSRAFHDDLVDLRVADIVDGSPAFLHFLVEGRVVIEVEENRCTYEAELGVVWKF